MDDRSGMSADIPLDETLNRGPLALLLRRQYEFPFRIKAAFHPYVNNICLVLNLVLSFSVPSLIWYAIYFLSIISKL